MLFFCRLLNFFQNIFEKVATSSISWLILQPCPKQSRRGLLGGHMTDFQVIASVIRYLQKETGAVSANVHLPSGKNVVVYADGTVKY